MKTYAIKPETSKSKRDTYYILGSILCGFLFLGIVFAFIALLSYWGPKTKKVQLEIGEATFVVNRTGWNRVKVVTNSGLVAQAEWRPNPSDEFGYDIAEPKVNQNTDRLAVMILLRAAIANYMNGEYD